MSNVGPDKPDDRTWISISDLARELKLDKSGVSRRVKRLEDRGELTTKLGPAGTKLVVLAEFYRASEQTLDGVRALNGSAASDLAATVVPTLADPTLARQQARRAGLDADLKELELQERLGQLLPIKEIEAAMTRCAEAMVRAIDQISGCAEDLAAAIMRDGVAGARTMLRDVSRDLRARIGQEMRLLEVSGKAEHAGERGLEEA